MIIPVTTSADGTALIWLDTDDRRYHDASGDVEQVRPLTGEETTRLEEALAARERRARDASRLQQLRAGYAGLQAARVAAAGDVAAASAGRDAAATAAAQVATQLDTVGRWAPSPAYNPADLVAVRDHLAAVLTRQRTIITALQGLFSWRIAVDENAVATDDALMWLARLAADDLDGQ